MKYTVVCHKPHTVLFFHDSIEFPPWLPKGHRRIPMSSKRSPKHHRWGRSGATLPMPSGQSAAAVAAAVVDTVGAAAVVVDDVAVAADGEPDGRAPCAVASPRWS